MVIHGVVDSDRTETEFIDLCCSIGDSLHFCICFTKKIIEIRRFHVADTKSPRGYTNTFTFHVTFPDQYGTRDANKKFVEEKLVHLLEVVLDIPIGLEGNFDPSGKPTYALIQVPD